MNPLIELRSHIARNVSVFNNKKWIDNLADLHNFYTMYDLKYQMYGNHEDFDEMCLNYDRIMNLANGVCVLYNGMEQTPDKIGIDTMRYEIDEVFDNLFKTLEIDYACLNTEIEGYQYLLFVAVGLRKRDQKPLIGMTEETEGKLMYLAEAFYVNIKKMENGSNGS